LQTSTAESFQIAARHHKKAADVSLGTPKTQASDPVAYCAQPIKQPERTGQNPSTVIRDAKAAAMMDRRLVPNGPSGEAAALGTSGWIRSGSDPRGVPNAIMSSTGTVEKCATAHGTSGGSVIGCGRAELLRAVGTADIQHDAVQNDTKRPRNHPESAGRTLSRSVATVI
jgi:hypothetical protein